MLQGLLLVDTHCHLADVKFRDDVEAVIARATDAGVAQMISVGAIGAIENDRLTVEIAEHHRKYLRSSRRASA